MAPYVDDDDVIVLSSDTDEDQAPQPRSVLKTSSSNTPKASAAPRNAKRKLDAYTTGNDGRSISEGRDSGLGADEEDTNTILGQYSQNDDDHTQALPGFLSSTKRGVSRL